jgi:LPXTG-motif cell wall-anchored protein
VPPKEDPELVRLRQEVADLRAQLAAQPAGQTPAGGAPVAPGGRTGWWRPVVVTVLIVIAALIAPASVVAAWARDEIANTDRYVETVTPLASDPAVQSAIANRITTEIFNRIDVQAITQDAVDALSAQGLPPRVSQSLTALSGPIADGVRSFVSTQVTKLVESDAFEQAWVAANRAAHAQLVGVLTGEGTDAVSVNGDTVSLNLAALIDTVKQRLTAQGFGLAERIPTVNASFTIMQSSDIVKAQTAFRLLNDLAVWLPVIGILLLALAIYLARNRRRALVASALAVALSMLLLGAGLNIFRAVYLNHVSEAQLSVDAAAAIYDQLVEFIRTNLRAVLVIALAIAVGAWVSGPGGVAIRRGTSKAIAWVRGGAENAGLDTGPVGAWVYRWKTQLRAAIVGVAALVYVLQSHPTGSSALTVVIIAAVALLIVELLARPPATTEVTAPAA